MGRVDEVRKHYNSSDFFDTAANILFYVLALSAILLATVQQKEIKEIASTLFIVMVVLYFIVRYIPTLFFLPNAEKIRRKQLLSNSFSLPLVHETTQDYYNNPFPPSVVRLGANTLESSLFSQRILSKMLIFERTKVTTFFILWAGALAYKSISQEVIIIISQSIFSTEVIVRWINMELLRLKCREVYNDLYNFFLTKQDKSLQAPALVLDIFSSYECAKAAASIILTTKIFEKINPEVIIEWENIKKQLNII